MFRRVLSSLFTQRRKGIQFYVVKTYYNLRGKGSLRSNTNTIAGKAVKRERYFREVNLQEVNPGDDILEVDIPGDVNLFKSPH